MQYKVNIIKLFSDIQKKYPNIDIKKSIEIIKYMIELDLFQMEGVYLHCKSLKNYVGYGADKKYCKTKYAKMLMDERWLVKKEKILKRDNYTCENCGDKNNLCVHHLKYESYVPWETSDKYLITLCLKCHKKIHGRG